MGKGRKKGDVLPAAAEDRLFACYLDDTVRCTQWERNGIGERLSEFEPRPDSTGGASLHHMGASTWMLSVTPPLRTPICWHLYTLSIPGML